MPTLIEYNENGYQEREEVTIDQCFEGLSTENLLWLNLEGAQGNHFDDLVRRLNLHPLMVEDIRNHAQLPRFEMIEGVSFLSIQMIHRHTVTHDILFEHVSIMVHQNLIITVQEEKAGDVFDVVRQKIRLNYKRMYKNGPDYLFLSVVDAIVDEYMACVDSFRQPVEDLELTMVKRPGVSVMKRIMDHKTKLNEIRRLAAPLREELQRVRTENPDLIKKPNQIFFRDIQDHMNTLIANFENFREMLRDLADLHHSNQNLQLNNTMKTLTSISAIFIPLTFIVGVYGMNFKHFPELDWEYGYALIWAVMLAITGGLVWYMKKKRWF